MTSLGIQAWVQLLSGVRMAFAHTYLAEPFNVLQVLGNSYRLASTTGASSSVVHGRFAVGFCQAMVARMLGAVADAGVPMVTRLDCSWLPRTRTLHAAAKEPAVSLRPPIAAQNIVRGAIVSRMGWSTGPGLVDSPGKC
jgi:hypothetical protein